MDVNKWFLSLPPERQAVLREDKWMLANAVAQAATEAERVRICAAIKAEDDHCADGDYMMDSDDCIKVVRGTWQRPDWNGSNAEVDT